ncbi:hypothetical protein Hanom_Chr11g00993581 [Helianthus anomalus]
MLEGEEEEEPAAQLIIRKRSRDETTAGASIVQKAGGIHLIGKQSNLHSLYKFSPEAKKKTPEKRSVVIRDPQEPAQKRPKVIIKPLKTAEKPTDKVSAKEKQKEKKKTVEDPVRKVAEREKENERKKVMEKAIGGDPKDTRAAATTAHEKA